MRIEPTQLLQPITVSEDDLAEAVDILAVSFAHRPDAGQALPHSSALETAIKLKSPKAWHFESNGWTVGSFTDWPNLNIKPGLFDMIRSKSPAIFIVDPQGKPWATTVPKFKAILEALPESGPSAGALIVEKLQQMIAADPANMIHAWPLNPPLAPISAPKLSATADTGSTPETKTFAERKIQRHEQEKVSFAETTQAFHTALGPSVSLALELKTPFTSITDWLNAGNTVHRSQALTILPGILGHLISEHWNREEPGRASAISADPQFAQVFSKISDQIDAGNPWYETLADHLSNKESAYRTAHNLSMPTDYRAKVLRGLHRLSRLSPDQRHTMDIVEKATALILDGHSAPLDNTAVKSRGLGGLCWMTGNVETVDLPSTPEQHLGMMKLAYSLFSNKTKSHLNLEALANYRPALKGVIDQPSEEPEHWMVSKHQQIQLRMAREEITKWLGQLIGLPARSTYFDVTADVLEKGLSFKQFLDASNTLHRFHEQSTGRAAARQAAAIESLVSNAPEPLWSAGGPANFEDGGIAFKALQHPIALLKEGHELGHCVSGYSRYCFSGRSRIFSLLDSATGERATLEVVQRCTSEGWVAVNKQLFGPGNKAPSSKFDTAASRFTETLNRDMSSEPWPSFPTPQQWESQETGPDGIFFDQVRAWFNAKHKGLSQRLGDEIAKHRTELLAQAELAAQALPAPHFKSVVERRQNQGPEQAPRVPAFNAQRP